MGLLAFIASLPTRTIKTTHLCLKLDISHNTMNKYTKELVRKGLLDYEDLRHAGGGYNGKRAFTLKQPRKSKRSLETKALRKAKR